MECSIAHIDVAFQIAHSCSSHLGVILDEDFEDLSSVDGIVLKLAKKYISPAVHVHTLELQPTTHLPEAFEALFGLDLAVDNDIEEEETSDFRSKTQVVVLHHVDQLSIQNQAYLSDLMAVLSEAALQRPTMIISSFFEHSLRTVHPQLLHALLLCPHLHAQPHSFSPKLIPSATPVPRYLSVYIRDIICNVRHDVNFLGMALAPEIVETVERVLAASGTDWSLSAIRECVPYILYHRLQLSSHLNATGGSKLALILASIANVPLPP